MNADEITTATEEIRKLKARYFRLMDNKRWQEFAKLFAEDASFDASAAMLDPLTDEDKLLQHVATPVEGRQAILDYVSNGLNEKARSFHEGFMPEINIHSTTSASATWSMEDRVWIAEGPIAEMHGYGYYHEVYVFHSGHWLIKTLKITRLKVDLTYR